jgi:apolipoprotein N-acyltransferase
VNSLLQLRVFGWGVLLPLLLGGLLQRVWRARVRIDGALLVLEQRSQRVEIALERIVALRPWRLPLPAPGVHVELDSGARRALALEPVESLLRALRAAGAPVVLRGPAAKGLACHAQARHAARSRWLDHPLLKFGAFSLLLALPAFRLHQHIAFGSTFGEMHSAGVGAWFLGLALWWAAWALGLMLCAAVLRVGIEAVAAATLMWNASRVASTRRVATNVARTLYYLGVPGWMAWRLLLA